MKVLIIDKNTRYVQRLTNALQQKYAGRYELYSITDLSRVVERIREIHPDVVVADKDTAESDSEIIPFVSAYFVNNSDIEKINDKIAFCKYRSVDEIHQDILTVLADASNKIVFRTESGDCDIIVFTSPAGGTGCSSLAGAYVVNRAKARKKTLFLTLDPYSDVELMFCGNGKNSMSELVYAIKSRSNNFAIKIETCLKKTSTGICYFGTSKNALDILELTFEDKQFLLSGLKKSGLFDVIVLDIPFSIDRESLKLLEDSRYVFWVNDGSRSCAKKIDRAYEALLIVGEKQQSLSVTGVVNNKYIEDNSYVFPIKIPEFGKIPKIDDDNKGLDVLSELKFFDLVG